jgi:hypothetical protein
MGDHRLDRDPLDVIVAHERRHTGAGSFGRIFQLLFRYPIDKSYKR